MSGIIPSANSRSAAQWPPQSPGQKPYPEMAKVPDNKPLLQSMGATGVAIFSGIITSEEYNSDFFWRDGIKIYEQMLRSDGQIRAIRTVLENPIKRATWSIEPGSESPRDKEIASFVDSCLFHDMRYTTADGRTRTQSWAQIVHHILMHLWYGFIPFEINWRVEDGWVKWAKWEPLLPRTVWRWWVGRDTELVGIQQWTFKDYNYSFVDIPADKLLLFVHQQEGANFEGLSLLRTAYKHWWYKSNFEKIEAIGLERNAVVPPVISLPENFTQADVAAAQTLGANMRASELGYATLPPGWMLEYPKGMQPFTSQVQPAIQYHDVMIARNVLAQFINLGSTETGAFALADAQQQMFLEALEAVTDYICDVINTDAIRRLVDYNYDNVEVYPQLRASRLANADITQIADALGKLKAREANFINPGPEMEDYLREQFGFPKAPQSVVQATNPTAESAPERPENANANDHSDQQSNVKQTQRPNPAATADTTAANNAIAPSSPGDGGALSEASERSEALDEVRLLREAIGAIAGVDAVDRGMQFINPNHDQQGRFAAGGPSATAAQRAQEHETRAVRKEAAARQAIKKRDAARARGDHQAAARYHAEAQTHLTVAHRERSAAARELAGGGRKTIGVPTRTERKVAVKHWSGDPMQAQEADSGMRFFNPNHDPSNGEFASGGGSGSGEGAPSRGGSGRGAAKSKSAGGSKARAAKRTTGNDYLNQKVNYGGIEATRGEVIKDMQAQGHSQEVIARYLQGLELGGHVRSEAEGKPTSSGGRAAKAEKPAEESIHEKSARAQREGGLKAEVKPGKGNGTEHLTPTAGGPEAANAFDTRIGFGFGSGRGTIGLHPERTEHTEYVRLLYGEHQLGAALSGHSAETLREKAAAHGLSTSGSKAALVSRITTHATNGRYSANFGTTKSSGGKSMTPEAHAAKAATLKAALDKAQAAYDAHMARAPKLSERSMHDEEGRRLLAEVQRAQAALEALSSDGE